MRYIFSLFKTSLILTHVFVTPQHLKLKYLYNLDYQVKTLKN